MLLKPSEEKRSLQVITKLSPLKLSSAGQLKEPSPTTMFRHQFSRSPFRMSKLMPFPNDFGRWKMYIPGDHSSMIVEELSAMTNFTDYFRDDSGCYGVTLPRRSTLPELGD